MRALGDGHAMADGRRTVISGRGSSVSSDCGRYRYMLSRHWDSGKDTAAFIMLNPSIADAETDDPTIRRCIRFARDWGYGSLQVVNLFALRATRPLDLLAAADPVGAGNDEAIQIVARRAAIVVAAWGSFPMARAREQQIPVLTENRLLHALGLTKCGYPRHPLYVPANVRPIPLFIHGAIETARCAGCGRPLAGHDDCLEPD